MAPVIEMDSRHFEGQKDAGGRFGKPQAPSLSNSLPAKPLNSADGQVPA